MSASIDICKMALSHIRGGTITSFNDGTLQSDQCKLWFDTLRDQMLEDAPWGFATRVEPLALLDSATYDPFDWVYAYQYPTNCVRINKLVLNYESASSDSSVIASRFRDWALPVPDIHSKVDYQILDIDGAKVIAANDTDLRVNYNLRVTDANKFDTSFKLGLSHLLASMIAVPIAGEEKGVKLQERQLQLYTKFINNAIAKTLNERHQEPADSEFITVRS